MQLHMVKLKGLMNTSIKSGQKKVNKWDPIKLKSCDQPAQHIKKQRHYLANKGPSSQCYGFSSGHVWMRQLDYKER